MDESYRVLVGPTSCCEWFVNSLREITNLCWLFQILGCRDRKTVLIHHWVESIGCAMENVHLHFGLPGKLKLTTEIF